MSTDVKGLVEKDQQDSKVRLRLWLQFLKLSRSIETQLRDNFRQQFNATLPRFDVMAALSRFPTGLKMSQISSELRVSNGNMTGIVDRLEAERSVVRVAVPGDRRAHLIKLTPKGRKEFNAQARAHETWVDELLSVYSVEEAAILSDQLNIFTHPSTDKE